MFKLRIGYALTGIATGLVLLFGFIGSFPDGKLHIVFCDVGQGDGAYIRFPDGRDMVIDGGPNDKILECLGRHMPFWDRQLDIVLLTHPQKDHMQGLLSIVDRFDVEHVVRSDIENSTEGFKKFMEIIQKKKIFQKFAKAGDRITIGSASLLFLWPVNGLQSKELNDHSLVFWLRYGSFDSLFTGDADTRVSGNYTNTPLSDNLVEVLKVPHHGSKTGMNQAFVDWVHPKLAVISVGKNSYGHPSVEALSLLQSNGARIFQTDKEGDIEIVSNGNTWFAQ